MKFLAIESEIPGVNWEFKANLLKEEAQSVYKLLLANVLREVYFNDQKNAVLILECNNKATALQTLAQLPLVQNGYITFNLMELQPYSGLSRLMDSH